MNFNPFFSMSAFNPEQKRRDMEALQARIEATEARRRVYCEVEKLKKKHQELSAPIDRPDFHTALEKELSCAQIQENWSFRAAERRCKVLYWVGALLCCLAFVLLTFFVAFENFEGFDGFEEEWKRYISLGILAVGSLVVIMIISLFLYIPNSNKQIFVTGIVFGAFLSIGNYANDPPFPLAAVVPYLFVLAIPVVFVIVQNIFLRSKGKRSALKNASAQQAMEKKMRAAVEKEEAAYAQVEREQRIKLEALLREIAAKEKELAEKQAICEQIVAVQFASTLYYPEREQLEMMLRYLREGSANTLAEANQMCLAHVTQSMRNIDANYESKMAEIARENEKAAQQREEQRRREEAERNWKKLHDKMDDLQTTAEAALEEERRRTDEIEKARRELEHIRRGY